MLHKPLLYRVNHGSSFLPLKVQKRGDFMSLNRIWTDLILSGVAQPSCSVRMWHLTNTKLSPNSLAESKKPRLIDYPFLLISAGLKDTSYVWVQALRDFCQAENSRRKKASHCNYLTRRGRTWTSHGKAPCCIPVETEIPNYLSIQTTDITLCGKLTDTHNPVLEERLFHFSQARQFWSFCFYLP